jgi:uncharacterized damage-inducible protein DinB
MITKPQPDEYPAYASTYVNKVPEGPIIEILEYLRDNTYNFFSRMTATQADYAYAEGKWTVKEVLGHMIDTERVFAFRALCFSRGDKSPLPGFEQDDYVANSAYDTRSIQSLAGEFKALRDSTIYLYSSFTGEQCELSGIANGNPVSVRALVYMTVGHELHHLEIVKEKYI